MTRGRRKEFLQDPWGVYAPGKVRQALIRISRSASNTPLGRRLALEARRLARLGLTGPLDTRVWGLALRLFPRGNISEGRLLFMPQLLDTVERGALAQEARAGWVFADLGANVGSYTYWVTSLGIENCRVLAVEPDPELSATLRFNLATNQASNVRVFEGAVVAESGRHTLEISSRNRGENVLMSGVESPVGPGPVASAYRSRADSGPRPERAEDLPPISVAGLSLRDLLDQEGIDSLHALKIDVEGGELEVLRAFFETAPEGRWPSLLITEWKGTRSAMSLASLLDQNGYRLSAATRLNRVYRRP